MSTRLFRYLLLAVGLCHAAMGSDFIPKGKTIGMITQGPTMTRWDLNYGYSTKWAIRASRIDWDSNPLDTSLTLQGLQATYVLHRSYTEEGILNIYLSGGPLWAAQRLTPERRAVGFEGIISADYETTQIYLRTVFERFESSISTTQISKAQVLYAPWESSYARPTLWVGIQAQQMQRTQIERSLAPMIRIVSRRTWFEAGIHLAGESRGKIFIQAMYLF